MYTAMYLVGSVLLSAVTYFIGSYSKEKGKNAALIEDIGKITLVAERAKIAATKEDIEEITDKVEKIKSDLVLAVNRRSKLFDIRIEIIKELYQRVLNVFNLLSQAGRFPAASKNPIGKDVDKKLMNEINMSLNKLSEYYISNSIFLTNNLDYQLSSLLNDINGIIIDFGEADFLRELGVVDNDLVMQKDAGHLRKATLIRVRKEFPLVLSNLKATIVDIISGNED